MLKDRQMCSHRHFSTSRHSDGDTCAVTQWFALGLDAPAGRREPRSRSTTGFGLWDGQQGATQLQGRHSRV